MSFTSCDDNNDDKIESYYVRYSVGIVTEGNLLMNFSNPDLDGNTTIQQTAVPGTVEVTVGPVKPGFKAEMTASIDGHAVDWMRIDVSHDDEPFVMKQFVRNGISLSYYVSEEVN